jgi:hypothetical protein
VLGVLTRKTNPNVQYELGIAHATQPIQRQVLLAEGNYKPAFDTKDLIFMRYSPTSLSSHVDELTLRIVTAISEWKADTEQLVRHAIAKITPFEFEIVMIWAHADHFAVGTSGSGPDAYEKEVATLHGSDSRFMDGVFIRHCGAIGKLQQNGLLGLSTESKPPIVEFSYYWTDLGNLVLVTFGLIPEQERVRRYGIMPPHLRRVT